VLFQFFDNLPDTSRVVSLMRLEPRFHVLLGNFRWCRRTVKRAVPLSSCIGPKILKAACARGYKAMPFTELGQEPLQNKTTTIKPPAKSDLVGHGLYPNQSKKALEIELMQVLQI